jgi:hypothetical protein
VAQWIVDVSVRIDEYVNLDFEQRRRGGEEGGGRRKGTHCVRDVVGSLFKDERTKKSDFRSIILLYFGHAWMKNKAKSGESKRRIQAGGGREDQDV